MTSRFSERQLMDTPERPAWAHEYIRYAGDGAWICDGCPLESCDCDEYV